MSKFLYPLFLDLQVRSCVVVGGGDVAEAKVLDLLRANASVRVIAQSVTQEIASLSQQGRLRWEARSYREDDLRDAFLVIAASDRETNAAVFQGAESQRIFCNAVDDVEHCSCYAPAVVRRGPLQIAISTSGHSPALAQRLRREFEEQFGPEYGPWLEALGAARIQLFQDERIDSETRRRLLHEMAGAAPCRTFRRSLPEADCAQNSAADNGSGDIGS